MDDTMQTGWDAAVAVCLSGHDTDCSYGGLSPSGGYWLTAEGCPLDHGDRCAWCPEAATTGFAGWADDGFSIFAVPACQPHADQWVAERPGWRRDDEPAGEPQTAAEVLAGLSPFARAVAEDFNATVEDALMFGVGGSGAHQFTGFLDASVGLAPASAPPSGTFGTFLQSMLDPSDPAAGPPFVHDPTPRGCEFCAAAEAPECRDGVPYRDGGEANDCEDVYVGPCGCDCHKPQPSYTLEWVRTEQSAPAPVLSRREADRWARRIARLFDVPSWITGASPPPLAIDGHAYRQRQRNRVKRRRR